VPTVQTPQRDGPPARAATSVGASDAGSGNSDANCSGNSEALTSEKSGRVKQTPSGHRLAAPGSEGRDDRHAQTARNPGSATRRSQSTRGGHARRRRASHRSTRRQVAVGWPQEGRVAPPTLGPLTDKHTQTVNCFSRLTDEDGSLSFCQAVTSGKGDGRCRPGFVRRGASQAELRCVSNRSNGLLEDPRWCAQADPRAPPARHRPVVVDDVELLIRAAHDGVGLAFISDDRTAAHLAGGALVRVLEDYWCASFPSSSTTRVGGINPLRSPLSSARDASRTTDGRSDERRLDAAQITTSVRGGYTESARK
jgi:hypothetical protein